MDLITVVVAKAEWIEETVRVLDDLTKHLFIAECQFVGSVAELVKASFL